MGVDDAGDGAVVDVAVAGFDVFYGGDAFFFGLVREHGAKGDVADTADVRVGRAVFRVDDDAAFFVRFDAHGFEVEIFSVGATSDGNEDDISFQL